MSNIEIIEWHSETSLSYRDLDTGNTGVSPTRSELACQMYEDRVKDSKGVDVKSWTMEAVEER